MKRPAFLTGIGELAAEFDVFVIDLWGTLHDGVRAYPGVAEALGNLIHQGKIVALLSNAPRRAALAEALLAEMGIEPYLYSLLLTSGEAVHAALRDRPDSWHRKLAGPCWHLGPARDRSVFDGLDLELVAGPEGAGFCVATGVDRDDETVEDYRGVLDRGLELGLPMICANPDIIVPVGDSLVVCPGAFAEYYALRGGDVFWHGKPRLPIYERLFGMIEATGGTVDRARTLAIGDGLATDIAGAAAAGIRSMLVLGGIHAASLGAGETLDGILAEAAIQPDWVLPSLIW